MQLSQKQKPFTLFFSPFLKCILSFEDFEKKTMTLIADVILKLWTPKNEVRELSKKSRLRGPLDKQHGKRTKNL